MSRHEYPIVFFWYTKYKGKAIEWIIDHDPEYICWCIKTFQDITPAQAQYFKNRWHKEIRSEFIQDVKPYEWQKGDPDNLYMELCETRDLEGTLKKYRENPQEITLFD